VAVVGGCEDEAAKICHDILAEKLSNPCFIELLWSYWNEEGGLMRTLNVITGRFHGPPRTRPTGWLGDRAAAAAEQPVVWGWIRDSPPRFIEALHHLLAVCAEFYVRDDDTTVIADGFGVLNVLKRPTSS
jgi:hypothetical protein